VEEIISKIKEKLIQPFYEFPNPTSIELKCKDIDLILDLIKEYQKIKMKLQIEQIDNKYNKEEASEEMIPRYKIKAKIEELENEIKGIIEKERDVEDYQCEQYYKIQVLQELLEEEE